MDMTPCIHIHTYMYMWDMIQQKSSMSLHINSLPTNDGISLTSANRNFM